jgi:hypothetical protein
MIISCFLSHLALLIHSFNINENALIKHIVDLSAVEDFCHLMLGVYSDPFTVSNIKTNNTLSGRLQAIYACNRI